MPQHLRIALVDSALTTCWLYRAEAGRYTVHHARTGPGQARIELSRERALHPGRYARVDPGTALAVLDRAAREPYREGPPRAPGLLSLCVWRGGDGSGFLAGAEPTGTGYRLVLREVLAREDGHGVDLLARPGAQPLWRGDRFTEALAWAVSHHRARVPAQARVAATA